MVLLASSYKSKRVKREVRDRSIDDKNFHVERMLCLPELPAEAVRVPCHVDVRRLCFRNKNPLQIQKPMHGHESWLMPMPIPTPIPMHANSKGEDVTPIAIVVPVPSAFLSATPLRFVIYTLYSK